MFCVECGKSLNGSPKFCSECGNQVEGFKLLDQPHAPITEINITELISKHFELFGGYGTSPEDRFLIEKATWELLDDLTVRIDGTRVFEGEEIGINITDTLADHSFPFFVRSLVDSKSVPENIMPIISTFLLVQLIGLDIRVDDKDLHKLIQSALKDNLSDANLYVFGIDFYGIRIHNFYQEHFPEGTNEFLQNVLRQAENSNPGRIECPPRRRAWTPPALLESVPNWGEEKFFDGEDRKKRWQGICRWHDQVFYAKIKTVKQVFESQEWLNKYIQHLEENYLSHMLEEEWLGLIQCRESAGENKSPNDGAQKLIFFTSGGVCEIFRDTTFMSRARSKPDYIKRQNIVRITVGTKIHETHSGFGSSAATWMTLTIETTGHRINTKYIYLGDSEKQMNENRPKIMANLDSISKQYSLEAGTTVQSSSGFTITPSIGFWHSI